MKYIIDIETKRTEVEKGSDDVNIYSATVLADVELGEDEARIEYTDDSLKTVITTSQKLVTVYASGAARSSLVFAEGKHCSGEYSITEGALQVTTYAYKITNNLNSPEKTLTIDYEIDFGGNMCDRSIITYKLK